MGATLNPRVRSETIDRLISLYKDDSEMIEVIADALDAFEKYHQAIYSLEVKRKLFANGAMSSDVYRDTIPQLDSVRSKNHNTLLAEVNVLNRLAEHNKLPLFYDGEVSEIKPIRTWVADAILEYIRQVIVDRVT